MWMKQLWRHGGARVLVTCPQAGDNVGVLDKKPIKIQLTSLNCGSECTPDGGLEIIKYGGGGSGGAAGWDGGRKDLL